MSWSDLLPSASTAQKHSDVTLAMTCPTLKFPQGGLHLTVRADAIAWLVVGTRVRAQLGHGEHAHLLRLTRGDHFIVRRIPRSRTSRGLWLRVPPGVAVQKHKAVVVEYDYSDDWLEITLPDWARVPDPPEAASPSTPFRGALSRLGAVTDGARRQAPIPFGAGR